MQKRKEIQSKRVKERNLEKGLVIVFTGNGKGKTTAALGMGLRTLGHGHKVAIIQFIKGAWTTGEKKAFEKFSNNIESAIKNSDLIIIHTEWNDFKSINFNKIVLNKKFILFDMRNIYDPNKMKDQKINYFGVGR